MFQEIQEIIKDAGLKGVDVGIRIIGQNSMSVMLSFQQATDFDLKLLEKIDNSNATQNADAVVALRSALNTPLVVIGAPNEILNKLTSAIVSLREGVVHAATTYSALDISALLSKATANAKSAKSNTNAKGKPTTAAKEQVKSAPNNVDDEGMDEGLEDDEAVDEAPKAAAAQKETQVKPEVKSEPAQATAALGFDTFDSL